MAAALPVVRVWNVAVAALTDNGTNVVLVGVACHDDVDSRHCTRELFVVRPPAVVQSDHQVARFVCPQLGHDCRCQGEDCFGVPRFCDVIVTCERGLPSSVCSASKSSIRAEQSKDANAHRRCGRAVFFDCVRRHPWQHLVQIC